MSDCQNDAFCYDSYRQEKSEKKMDKFIEVVPNANKRKAIVRVVAIFSVALAGAVGATTLDGSSACAKPDAGAQCINAAASRGAAVSGRPWRPSVRWYGFNLLGMFCQTKMEAGDTRICGYFPEDRFRWMHEWGFNFARLPLDYRFFVEKGDWMKLAEAQLSKLDDAVRLGRKHGIHVQINFHRAPGYCCNPPQEPKSLFRDREPLVAFTNMWSVQIGRAHV